MAIVLVGGSLFFWLVVMPESHRLAANEVERTQMVGRLAKRFGRVVNLVLPVLLVTGIYNLTWYLPSLSLLFAPYGRVLLVKMVMVVAFLFMTYLHNVVFGGRIVRFAREGKVQELARLRRWSRPIAYINVALMVMIVGLGVLL
ncbi:MAG: CopD family protein [Thaumarchaeota archaeon]|nr:CopD family protein [Nitrososphaerota archaeon]